jgi:hypothetical protein
MHIPSFLSLLSFMTVQDKENKDIARDLSDDYEATLLLLEHIFQDRDNLSATHLNELSLVRAEVCEG